MSTEFSGFSNSEIQNLKHENKPLIKSSKVLGTKIEKVFNKDKKSHKQDEKKEKRHTSSSNLLPDNGAIKEENGSNEAILRQSSNEKSKVFEEDPEPHQAEVGKGAKEHKIGPTKVCESVDDFEKYNKEIKEENLEKKKVLLRAILDRSKKTKEEQMRLALLRKELEDIDKDLSVDVSALRDSIEEYSVSYMKARQRFEKAEKEYTVAKADYISLSEKKESLTEKLLHTIQQTEINKAKKLSELLQTLEISELQINNGTLANHVEP